MTAPPDQQIYEWETATIGDSGIPFSMPVTEDGIVEYCRSARYENPVYTSLAAAKEAGHPGSVTPAAMLLAVAPLNLVGVAKAAGCVLPVFTNADNTPAATGKLTIRFRGAMLQPGDVVTSITSVDNKFQDEKGQFVAFRVIAQNQRGEPVVDYCRAFLWPTSDR